MKMVYHIILYVTRRKWGNTGITRCFDDITYSSFWITRGKWGWENMMWNMMDAMRCHGAGYDGSIEDEREKEHTFTNVRLRWFDKRPFKFAIHEEEEDGVDGLGGEVMFFNTTRSHAIVVGRVLHSAQLCRPNHGLLFFEITPLPNT